MSESEQNPFRRNTREGRWRWIGGVALLLIVAITVTGIVIYRDEPTLRATVIETLSTRFKSKVELDAFHVSLLKGLQVSGAGLRIFGDTDPNNHEPGVQPIISVAEFRFRMGILDFLRATKHVDTVYAKGLQLNLPPREQRGQMKNMGPKGGKIEIVVDRFVCDDAQLIVNTLRSGKLPLEFDIESLKMTTIGPGSPMHFDANLTNPKPVGNILSTGLFGPWQADSPRDTPVSGTLRSSMQIWAQSRGLAGSSRPLESMPAFSTILSWMAQRTPQIFALLPAVGRFPFIPTFTLLWTEPVATHTFSP
jgi:hypothetical protein